MRIDFITSCMMQTLIIVYLWHNQNERSYGGLFLISIEATLVEARHCNLSPDVYNYSNNQPLVEVIRYSSEHHLRILFSKSSLRLLLREIGVQAVLSHGEVTPMRSDQEGVDAFIWTYFVSSLLVDKYTIRRASIKP